MSKKKKASAKKNTGRKTSSRRKTKAQLAQEAELKQIIAIVILTAVTLISYTRMGVVGTFLNNLQKFLFGKFYFVITGVIIFQIAMIMIARRNNTEKDPNKKISANPIAIILIIAAVLLWCALLDTPGGLRGFDVYMDFVDDLRPYFESSSAVKVGGGLVGALLFSLTTMLVDRTGTILIIAVLLVIAALLIVNLQVYKNAFAKIRYYFSTLDYEDEDDEEDEEEEEYVETMVDIPNLTPSADNPIEVPLNLKDNRLARPSLMLQADTTGEMPAVAEEPEPVYSNGMMDNLTVDEHPAPEDLPFMTEIKDTARTEEPVSHTVFMSIDDLVDRNDRPQIPVQPSYESSFENMNTYDEQEYDDVEADTLFDEEPEPVAAEETEPVPAAVLPEIEEPVKAEETPKPVPAEKPKRTPEEEREAAYRKYRIPKSRDVNLADKDRNNNNENVVAAREKGELLIQVLRNFDIEAALVDTHIGPAVTKFEIKPVSNVKVSRILGLADDIKMQLAVRDVRIEAPIPGHNAVGVEIPNVKSTPVKLKELIEETKDDGHPLQIYLGKDLFGKPVTCRLDKMPHLLIAGATGSGKSVCMNSIITSILMRTNPRDVKLLLVDPKKVEFTPYHNIPHLIGPVINDAAMASNALKVIVQIMDERYDAFSKTGVRNIQGYNDKVAAQPANVMPKLQKMPYIVVIIDELADLMLVAGKEVEASIQRITQLARAAGIHLIVATQRPSTDVITGVIKANIPSRIAFAVSSGIDSRTILDHVGAERLLGYGDMLYLPIGESNAQRVQGVYVSDAEVENIARYTSAQASPFYDDRFVALNQVGADAGEFSGRSEDIDPLYNEIKDYVIAQQKASTSLLQRRFGIGYNRAARMIDMLQDNGIIGPAQGSKPREVLISRNSEEE